ncbi:MAG: tetratricopeptide repeat protein [Candidatus Eisenbacteria bacterium]|nr:tetratricopeptide repeat protein [Candidatus Eisenbacteria bacterium]
MTTLIHRLFLLLALGVLMTTGPGTPDSHAALAPDADRLLLADSLFAAGRWADAAPIYRELTVAAPEVGRHWARYGGCLHGLGLVDEAALALTRAEAIGRRDPAPMTNVTASSISGSATGT